MMKINLEELLKELDLKTPFQEIPPESLNSIVNFLQIEKENRKQFKIKRLLKRSGIKQVKTFAQFDWRFNPKIKKEEIISFYKSPWIEQVNNLTLIGDTGLGKTHILKAICYESILQGHTTAFISAFDLISKINNARNPIQKINYLSKIRVLCIDELGYTFHKREDTDIIFQIISKRAEVLPTLISSNLAPKDWGSIFSGSAASAILDRLSYNEVFITFEGKSYRLLKKSKKK